MKPLEKLIDRIINRVNINLREAAFDVRPYIQGIIPIQQFGKFYAFYGLTPYHPLYFRFHHSSLAGSYFLGKCMVNYSVLYKSDIRGDELKCQEDTYRYRDQDIPLHDDEVIHIKDSFLVKTLVHNNSHDPENLEEFLIQNTVALHFANIHGSTVEGCYLAPFSTVDLTTLHDCVIGSFAYVQVGELLHQQVKAGRVWVRNGDLFEFIYTFPEEVLKPYIDMKAGQGPKGIFMDFIKDRSLDFQQVFDAAHAKPPVKVPKGIALSPFAVVKGRSGIGKNVLVAQRAYLDNAFLGPGANAQEHCYIIDSQLEGNDVTAHGGKMIHASLGSKVFVGFNSFLQGQKENPLSIGSGSIIMPHTIIDLEEPLDIPASHLVWGYIKNRRDLKNHSLPLKTVSAIKKGFTLGGMRFQGNGAAFVHAFQHRIDHILESNGAFFDGTRNQGHAQKDQDISFNTIQPYATGPFKGLYPTIEIRPYA
jgi:carbonic anhydrase/acetyltransferase-like protein (isoleucine patch superfamily)